MIPLYFSLLLLLSLSPCPLCVHFHIGGKVLELFEGPTRALAIIKPFRLSLCLASCMGCYLIEPQLSKTSRARDRVVLLYCEPNKSFTKLYYLVSLSLVVSLAACRVRAWLLLLAVSIRRFSSLSSKFSFYPACAIRIGNENEAFSLTRVWLFW